jgi:predicted PurR-regulated permease PerM
VTEPRQSWRRLRRLGEACLWLLVIAAAVLAVAHVAARLRLVVLPVALALVLATVLAPVVGWLKAQGWREGAAALAALTAVVFVLGGLLALLAPPVVDQFTGLDIGITAGVDRVQDWLADSPLPLDQAQITNLVDNLQQQLSGRVNTIAASAATGAFLVLEVVTGVLLAVVVLFFLLKDGERIWAWAVSLAPEQRRHDVEAMGARAWTALGGFVRGQSLVALFDSVLIGIALAFIGVPLVLPLAVLTFFGAYVPVIGATLTGLLAVLVALVAEGPLAAALTLGAIVAVQQIEGNVFQPFIVGRAIDTHPLAILLGVTAGAALAGIIGAMIAPPLVAVGAALLRYLREQAEPRRLVLAPDDQAAQPARDPTT